MQSRHPDPTSLIAFLQQHRVLFADGLSDLEVAKLESTFAFRFPPDLRQLLQHALPVSPGFVNWRDDPDESLRQRLDWPADGICFDIEHNFFWWEEWGPRPIDTPTACEVARHEIAKMPALIPIYNHRYIPAEPHLTGNPVFSVHQTDIIYYGSDLSNYFYNEFSPHDERDFPAYADVRSIRFWSQIVESWADLP